MYMRLLQLRVDPDKFETLHQFYNKIVIPELQSIPGCQFASLIQSTHQNNEFFSMTLWDTKKAAEAYNKSEVYQRLLNLIKPILAESSEWKINLSESLELEYGPASEEPVLREFAVAEQATEPGEIPAENPRMYVRIFSVKLQEGKLEECRRLYREEVIPTLKTTAGCRYAYLIESLQEKNEVVSVTIWDSKEDADAYERSGRFDELVDKVKHTFSQFFHWKMALEKSHPGKIKTTDDAQLAHYSTVTAKRFI